VNNGQLEFVANPNIAITSFTQDDINNSRIALRHSGPLVGTNFNFTISDGGEDLAVTASGTFNLTVDNTNDAPIISTNAGQTIDEGATLNITTAMLDSFDPDDFGTGLDWTASNLTNGILQVNGVTQNTFTQADLDAGLVTFTHDGSETLGANFDIQVADGGEDLATPATGNFAMSITPINDAPIITTNTGATMNEGASLTVTSAMLDLTDADDTDADLTYTASNLSNGTIEVNSVAQNTFTQDDINNNRVVFIHDDSETTSAGFDISLADDGADGAGADTGSFAITVTPINEAPTITVNTGVTIDEAASVTITSTMLDMSDVDDADTDVTYTASNLSNGVIEVNSVAQNTFTQDDINNNRVVFIHDGSETTSAGFDISLADGGENTAAADTDSFAITVTPINEAATITVNTGVTIDEGASQTITSAMLDMADVDDADTDVTYTASNLSNGVIEVNSVVQNTFTQDDINNNLVVFIHDGSETTSAGFDISLADGGENSVSADTGSFSITVTPVNDAPILTISNGNTVGVNFNDYTVSAYWAGEDMGTATVSADGSTLTINGNPWKKINLPYNVTADTVISFDFRADIEGEVQGFGFDTDNDGGTQSAFQLLGTQLSYAPTEKSISYTAGDGWVHYDIPIGDFFTGNFNFMTFFADDDANLANDASFRNLVLFEDNAELRVNEGQSVVIDPTKLNVSDDDDSGNELTFTASNLSNGVVQVNGVTQNTFTQTDLNAGLVTFLHDSSETGSAGFDISVIDGAEDSVVASTGRFDMVVDPINDAPTITVNTGTTVLEGGSKTVTAAMLNMADTDDTNAEVTYTASNLAHGTIEVNGVVQNTFTQADIDNNLVAFIHDGSEIDGGFDVSLADGGENSAAAATASFALSRINVNDVPTDINADATSISELAEIGDVIATLGTVDVDLPSDSFTYTIMSDPDNMFMISGNKLLLNAEADYETATQHSVTIRTDDGNGGTFDKVFVIDIEDASELTLNTMPQDRPNAPRDGYVSHKIEEDRGYNTNGLIQSFITGNVSDQINAFYGSNGIGQIIRSNTTFEMQNMLDNRSDFVVFDSNLSIQVDETTENIAQNNQNADIDTLPQGKTVRDILSALKEMSAENDQKIARNSDSNAQDDTETAAYRDLYDEFEDTLTYQQRRQTELREALQAES
jgi:hypothetical protein